MLNNQENYKKELIEALQMLSENGYKCYIHNDSDNFYNYGYAITPSDNIICIQRDSFEWRGWTFTFKYIPGRETGGGCQGLEEPVRDITIKVMSEAEKQGLQFAWRLRAKLYQNSTKWFEQYWDKSSLTKI